MIKSSTSKTGGKSVLWFGPNYNTIIQDRIQKIYSRFYDNNIQKFPISKQAQRTKIFVKWRSALFNYKWFLLSKYLLSKPEYLHSFLCDNMRNKSFQISSNSYWSSKRVTVFYFTSCDNNPFCFPVKCHELQCRTASINYVHVSSRSLWINSNQSQPEHMHWFVFQCYRDV